LFSQKYDEMVKAEGAVAPPAVTKPEQEDKPVKKVRAGNSRGKKS
jgi:hypothetical protein